MNLFYRMDAAKPYPSSKRFFNHRWTQMDTDEKRGIQAPRKAHHLVTGENQGQNDVLTFLHLCLSVSICG
jgi:hypothetical protein